MAKKPKTKAAKKKAVKKKTPQVDVTDFVQSMVAAVLDGIFDGAKEPWRAHLRRAVWGAFGGLIYACLKNYFGESIGVWELYSMEPSPRRLELFAGYGTGGLISATCGAVAAWLSGQRSAKFLFCIGMLGVLILVNIFPGLQSKGRTSWEFENPFSARPAYAQQGKLAGLDYCVGDSVFGKGLKAFFGVREHYDKYAVVVASGKNLSDAQAKAKTISSSGDIQTRVGPRACDNDYYPIYATDYLTPSEAKAALEKLRKTVPDAFLMPGPRD